MFLANVAPVAPASGTKSATMTHQLGIQHCHSTHVWAHPKFSPWIQSEAEMFIAMVAIHLWTSETLGTL